MHQNIVAKIKTFRKPVELTETFINFFLPDLEVAQLKVFMKKFWNQEPELICQRMIPQQPDFLATLWLVFSEYISMQEPPLFFARRPEYSFIITIFPQGSQSTDEPEPFPHPQIYLEPDAISPGCIAMLDFGYRSSYNVQMTLPCTGRLLDTHFIFEALEYLCEQTELHSLYVMNPDLEATPWNHSFIFHRYPRAYIEDLQLILGLWSHPEYVETANIFYQRSPDHIAKLNEFMGIYGELIKQCNGLVVLQPDELAAILQESQASLGPFCGFHTFVAADGVGIYTDPLFENHHCEQPYLALLKHFCTHEALLPADIDPTDPSPIK